MRLAQKPSTPLARSPLTFTWPSHRRNPAKSTTAQATRARRPISELRPLASRLSSRYRSRCRIVASPKESTRCPVRLRSTPPPHGRNIVNTARVIVHPMDAQGLSVHINAYSSRGDVRTGSDILANGGSTIAGSTRSRSESQSVGESPQRTATAAPMMTPASGTNRAITHPPR